MLGSDAQSFGLGRIAALFAIVAVVALLAVGAHAHGEADADAQSCVACNVVHQSAAPAPSQLRIETPTAQIPHAEPARRALATQFEGALPVARAPPSTKPNS